MLTPSINDQDRIPTPEIHPDQSQRPIVSRRILYSCLTLMVVICICASTLAFITTILLIAQSNSVF